MYDGQWAEGRRHGKGKITATNGELLVGEWENGVLNGPGYIILAGEKKKHSARWFNGVRVELTGQFYYWWMWGTLLQIITLCLLYLLIFEKPQTGPNKGEIAWSQLYGIGLFWLFSMCEAYCCTTYRFLHKISSVDEMISYTNRVRATRPKISYRIECYHHVTKGVGGNRRKVRKVTHRAS